MTLFVSQELIMEKTGLLKNEYMEQKHLIGIHVDDPWWWVRTVLPFVMAYIYVWWLPKFVINPSYKREVKYKYQRKRMQLEEEKRLIEKEQKTIRQATKNETAKIELKKAEAKVAKIDSKNKWDSEYAAYVALKEGRASLEELKNVVYGRSGDVMDDYGRTNVSVNFMMLWDTNELIEFDAKSRGTIELSEKGRFFLRRFSGNSS